MGPVEFDTTALINKGASVHGWPAGHALDAEEAIAFAQDHGVECVVQRYSLDEVNEGCQGGGGGHGAVSWRAGDGWVRRGAKRSWCGCVYIVGVWNT
jgi:hypothetical protein